MSVKCANCGESIDESKDPPGGRAPCPKCGSPIRQVSESVSLNKKLGTHLAMEHQRDSETIGYSDGTRDGLACYGSKEESGEFSYGLEGRPPRGEQDTPRVCQILIQRLNEDGADWKESLAGEGDVDCRSQSDSSPDEYLQIQVVTAGSDRNFWSNLGSHKKVIEENVPVALLVAQIKAAIAHKANEQHIPESRRGDLVLALDANRLPAHAMEPTVGAFKNEHEAWARSLGFREIWIVGPSDSLTSKLC